jgi:phosphate:Na+ symporter
LVPVGVHLVDYDRADLQAAEEAEREVNAYRDQLRAEHLEALKHGVYDYPIGNAYSTLYAQYEKLADYVINVSEAIDPAYRHQS